MRTLWALQWRSKNHLNGERRHIINENCLPKLFLTRREAREWRDKQYGYIRNRKDLRAEPHGWRLPVPIKVVVTENLR